jgi:valyl-tRNA synthetase
MEAVYKPKKYEEKIYKFWERGGYFTPRVPRGKLPKIEKKREPFTILLPLPNANDPLHMGHALFTIQDILIRYHRMLGDPTLWLPGGDHAGIETQFVFEKYLAERGESRFDFDRERLYQKIADFVDKNRDINRDQLKRMGFSLDWTRYHYSLEEKIVETVLETFKKLHQDGLVYREERMVNFCTQCGTAFSDLEVVYQEKKAPLYYMKYGPFTLATTRPETKFGDTAVAVNPKDKRYQKWVGKEFIYQSLIGSRKIKVVADGSVDPDFGTGVVKVTPAHDLDDFEIAQRHNLKILKVINPDGKLNEITGRFAGLTIFKARTKVVKELKKRGDLVKIDKNYTHRVGTCYRCKNIIEPMLMPQWFVKTKPLAKPAIKAVRQGKTKIIPKKRFEKMYFDWMENIRDWNISRQIVWGPRIPAWYCLECNPTIVVGFINKKGKRVSGQYQELKEKYSFSEIRKGLQQLTAPKNATYSLNDKPCPKCGEKKILQETDTFDTWFLSGQWPLTTLGFPSSKEFKYFYPTSVLDTLWDILFFWVARMMMLGLYLAKEVPFRVIHLHARVVDKHGQKMSKSKGNVINPIKMIEKYGADALRMALIIGVSPGSDITLSDDKIRAMRNFANKVWNATRFVITNRKRKAKSEKRKNKPQDLKLGKEDEWILRELSKTVRLVTKALENYKFSQAGEILYQFFWHQFCDKYIESTKDRRDQAQPVLIEVLETSLRLLHPFIPYLTEVIWQKIKEENILPSEIKKYKSIMIVPWPKAGTRK